MNIFNRLLISIFLLLGAISTFSHATGTSNNIITDDKTDTSMVNTLPATDIVNLSAHIPNSTTVISNFIIKSLPSANLGTLYMADGTTVVTVGQRLTGVEADGLRFDPIENCTPAKAQFTYVGVSDTGVEGTVATVTLPLSVSSGCSATVTSDDKKNPDMLNTLGAVNILDLSGKDGNGNAVISFIITSLPSANQGVLYMADGTTAIRLNQTLTITEANGLLFDPNALFIGDVTFTYVALNNSGVRGNLATVTIPLVAPATGNNPIADNKNNPQMSNSLGAVNILDLSGKDGNGDAVNRFIITSLPSANGGILYMEDGATSVQVNQTLTLAEANGLRFDPTAGFVGDVTFTYVALDDNGIKSTNATVTIPLINPVGNAPTADDKVNPKMLNTLGAVNILDLSGKDSNGDVVGNFIITSLPSVNQGILYMSDGRTAVILNQPLTLVEANGLQFDPNIDFVGDVRFTYVAVDANGIKSSNATVTIPVVASFNTDIVTHDDVGIANGNSEPIVIDVLANDTGTLAGATVRLVNADGTFSDRITVNGEGVWSVNSDNMVIFTPVAPFVGTPSPIDYVVRDANGAVSNTSTVSINGKCVCKAYTEDVPVFSTFGLVLMMFLSMMVGLRLIKREIIES
jgi:CshA-type fibril repeat protein